MARPSKYDKKFARQAKKLCDLGATDDDLAEFFQVTQRTINNWKSRYKEFFQALSTAKDAYDDRVERALALRAIGYSHPHTDIRVVDDKIVTTETIKHYPPDTKAALAWLYNRRGDHWHPLPQGDGTNANMADVLTKLIDKLPD